eukprot:513553-Prymnesium_polylepis.1
MATTSAVLLKNERAALPLAKGSRVALLGSACDARHDMAPSAVFWDQPDYYVIGGSGRVISNDARSLRQALEARGVTLEISASDDAADAISALRRAD